MLRILSAIVVLAATLLASARSLGPVPALGPLLDPANGAWALARSAELPARATRELPGLGAPVEVVLDDRRVPHIFAATEEDAWRVQGYLVARDRLFQMELQVRAASGRLSGLVGPRAAEVDRTTRRRGLPWAAERLAAAADSGSLISRATRAYAAGVNAWIDGMKGSDLPLEYRLLGATPGRWQPLDTYYFFNQMALTLAYDDETLDRLRVRALVGSAATEALFPRNSPIQEPIEPNGDGAPRYDFVRPMAPPGVPDTVAIIAMRDREALDLALGWVPARRQEGDAVGSNNWAVAPRRTLAGHALLAGDPHLELTLPSIWYEIHLHVAGGTDVAGVTFAGAPGVVIGFNRNVAWSFTNTGADVRDHYAEKVDDAATPSRYLLDGEWKPVERRVEFVRGPAGELLAADTLYFTHRGPMVKEGTRWVSVRWTPFEAQGGEDFLRLDRARTTAEWLDAWKGFAAPAQNGLVADRAGAIAIRSTGRFPIRPGDGRGDEIRDGSISASDWIGDVPLADYPFSLAPAQGFLVSANQQPVDPRTNSRYFGSAWFSPWRAMRINQLLRADSAVTGASMRRYQTDPRSARADAFAPAFLGAVASVAGAGQEDDTLIRAGALLAQWDHQYNKENRRAVLFEAAMSLLPGLVWDELIPEAQRGVASARPVAMPQDQVLYELVNDSSSAWWDDRRTPAVEHRDEILARALRGGLIRALSRFGAPESSGWIWANAHHANIYHLLRIPALSALDLSVGGGPSTISPSSARGTQGPSWRMVVELGPEIRAWGIYPGGQSGNPASAGYLDRLPKWLAGELDPILFPDSPEDLPPARVRSRLTFTPAPSR